MRETIYREKQRFRDRLTYGLLALGLVGSGYGAVHFFTAERGDSILRGLVCLLLLIGFATAILYLRRIRMKVTVNAKGVKYKLSPFHRKSQKITWDEMETCEVVKSPLASRWHGSNIHFTREHLYSLSGRNGLSIRTKDGNHYFIGVRDVDALVDALDDRDF